MLFGENQIQETKKILTNHNTGNLLGGELGGRTQVGGVPKEQGTGKR